MRRTISACIATIICVTFIEIDTAQALPSTDFSTRALENMINPIAKKDLKQNVGAVVTIIHDGHIVLNKGYGSANLETKQAVDPNKTLFRIGSITKTFTAIAVMQLVEQSKLNLDADINTYLKTFKVTSPFGKPITLRHLLTHTAGFQESSAKIIFERAEDMKTLEQSLSNFLPKMVRAPGVASMYSNHGISLAGYIVEVISGKPYAKYVQDNILEPLGMMHSSAMQPLPAKLASDVANGYDAGDPKKPIVKPFEFIEISPAGSISATGTDMARYMQMLLNGGVLDGRRILKSSTLEMMLAPELRLQPGAIGQGFVFWRELFGDQIAFNHGGDTQWFHSEMRWFPKEKLAVFISVNSTNSSLRRDLLHTFKKAFFPATIPTLAGGINPQALQGISGASYRSLRLEDNKFTKILGLIQLHPKALSNGQLEMQGSVIPGQNLRLVQTAPLVYRTIKGPTDYLPGYNGFSFSNDGRYMMEEQEYTAYERVPFLETDYLHLGLLAFGLLSSLSVLLGALFRGVRAIVRRVRKAKTTSSRPRWTGVLAFLSATAFILTSGFAVLAVVQFVAEPPPILYISGALSIVAALLTIGLVMTSVQAWRKNWWSAFARLRYSVLTLACLGMVFFLNTWNLLGFHM